METNKQILNKSDKNNSIINLDNNQLNQKRNILIYNKYVNKNDLNDNNSKIIKKNIKVYYNKNTNDKRVSDAIIQTFNLSTNKQENKKIEQKPNIILPILPSPSPSPSPLSEIIEPKEPNKNEAKVAELKPVYPVYPYNRIINLVPLNENKYKYKYNIHRQMLLDMKDDFRYDNRYNYEYLMNKIKYGNNYNKSNSIYRYKLRSNYSTENIIKNWKNPTKINKLFI